MKRVKRPARSAGTTKSKSAGGAGKWVAGASFRSLYNLRHRALTELMLEGRSVEERHDLTRQAGTALKAMAAGRPGTPEPARMKLRQHNAADAERDYVPGMLVVRCKEDVVDTVPDVAAARVASVRTLSLPRAVAMPFDDLQRRGLLREVVPVFSRLTAGRAFSIAPRSVAAAFATSVRDSENEDLRGINMLRVDRAGDLRQIEKDLAGTPGIEYVHRVPRRWMTAAPRPLPNDPDFPNQWALKAIGWIDPNPLPDAAAVKVGVLDTGVDIAHPELQNIVKAYVHEAGSAADIVGHGTHVSGILSAEVDNGVGIAGVCHCDLTVWKIFGDTPDPSDGEYYVDEIAYQRALNAARNAGMRVVSLSIGGSRKSQTEELLFRRLVDSGATVVAAMGNEAEDGNPVEYPGAYPGVLAVGATGRKNQRASFSNTGPHIGICAPGVDILSILPLLPSAARTEKETGYAVWSGTSMATPHVSAAAALVIAKNPGLTPQQVVDRLQSTATKLSGPGGPAHTSEYGYGLLNLTRAV